MKYRRETRSLQAMGSKANKAFYVALPIEWVRAHGLVKGDTICVYYCVEADEVVVVPRDRGPVDEVIFVRRDR